MNEEGASPCLGPGDYHDDPYLVLGSPLWASSWHISDMSLWNSLALDWGDLPRREAADVQAASYYVSDLPLPITFARLGSKLCSAWTPRDLGILRPCPPA